MIGEEDRLRISCCSSTLDEPRGGVPGRGRLSDRGARSSCRAAVRRPEVARAGRGPLPELLGSRRDVCPAHNDLNPAYILATSCLSTGVR